MKTAKQIQQQTAPKTKSIYTDGRTPEERAERINGIKALNAAMEKKVRDADLMVSVDDDVLGDILSFMYSLKLERLEAVEYMQSKGTELNQDYIFRTREQLETLSDLASKERVEVVIHQCIRWNDACPVASAGSARVKQ